MLRGGEVSVHQARLRELEIEAAMQRRQAHAQRRALLDRQRVPAAEPVEDRDGSLQFRDGGSRQTRPADLCRRWCETAIP